MVFEPELRAILQSVGQAKALTIDRAGLERCLDDNKARYAAELAVRVVADVALPPRMPQAFRDAIAAMKGLT